MSDPPRPGRAPPGFQDPGPRAAPADDYFARKFRAPNGGPGPPAPLAAAPRGESGSPANGTPAVPKMGVRARVSEWPPRKDGAKEPGGRAPRESREAAAGYGGAEAAPPDVAPRAAGPPLGDAFGPAPPRGLHPVRQRSNSDVTLSDLDADEALGPRAAKPGPGAPLRREYGSTSSIDRQGLAAAECFLAGLRGGRAEGPRGPPDLFPRPVRGPAPLVSPSLHAAARISRGELARLAGLDRPDTGAPPAPGERGPSGPRRPRAEPAEPSLFRRLRAARSEPEAPGKPPDGGGVARPCSRHRCFAHYDVQSILFDIDQAVIARANAGKRKNLATGASAASQAGATGGGGGSPLGSREDLNSRESPEADPGDGKSNELLLSCPHFRNETGGEGERRIGLSRASAAPRAAGEGGSFESSLSSHCTNAGVSVLEVPRESQLLPREKVKRYIIEHVDLGAYYYRKFFYGKEHQNYFGTDENLGPVAVSIRREKVDDAKDKEGSQFHYRVVFRTSELTTLRGAILEDAVPCSGRPGPARGLPAREVLECLVPELGLHCLRLAVGSPSVSEQLLRLDEQGLSFQHKVGILYCRAGQGSEEEMYNNEAAGPAFDQFLDLLGQRVRLRGFTKYRAQLDTKTDSTGTHSLYTTYKDYELMFHVCTMLPFMPNNRQQLLRKRHIGNDIVTIVFQEPGALPFTPQTVRSHFQHVFVIVRVHHPCTENVCYSIGVSRSRDVPPFGPPIPKGVTFPKSAVFRDFLLAKVINAENAAHKSEKFRAMATRTRLEYLRDLAENSVTAATLDASSAKFSFITLGAKRREKARPRPDAHLASAGAVTWSVVARDYGRSADIACLLGVSGEFFVLVERESKDVVFNCSCRDVIGWTSGWTSVKVFYERGQCVLLSAADRRGDDVREVVRRLEIVTRGCETVEMTLRRNGLGQLGFHVNFEGIVADVEPFGFAWKAGLRQGSRLVEICKVAVSTLTHEQMIDLLRTSVTVKVVIIHPHEDGSPRRGCSELCRVPLVEYKLDSEGAPCEYKTPFRRNTTWHRVPTPAPAGQPPARVSPGLGPPDGIPAQQLQRHSRAALPRSTSFDRKLPDGARSSPSNQSSSSDPGPSGSSHWRQPIGYDGCQSPLLQELQGPPECEGAREQEEILDGTRHPEIKWPGLPPAVLSSYSEPTLQKEGSVHDCPHKLSLIGERACSSCAGSSSSDGSTASGHSEDRALDAADLLDADPRGQPSYGKGAPSDGGEADPAPRPPSALLGPVHLPARVEPWAEPAAGPGLEREPTPGSPGPGASDGDFSPASSLSSGSQRSGSPAARCPKSGGSLDTSKVYIVSHGGGQQAAGSAARPFHRLGAGGAYVIGWKRSESSPTPEEVEAVECQGLCGGMDGLCVPSVPEVEEDHGPPDGQRGLAKDDLLKLLFPGSPGREEGWRKFSVSGSPSPRRSLYRTLSDESVSSVRRDSRSSVLDQALPNDILFSTTPPYLSTLPPRSAPPPPGLAGEFWLSDTSGFTDPRLMPLPDAASGLDWSHLVDAARAFEGLDSDEELRLDCPHTSCLDRRAASFCSLTDLEAGQDPDEPQECVLGEDPADEAHFVDGPGEAVSSTLTGKVNQLELILRQLQTDLRKEKQDKAALQAEVQHLRRDNQRLQEESQAATAQLRKFTDWFFNTVDRKP
ncbi:signal-induced proliferation-associated 1-like protein 2 isoform X2 [Ornithorhynchus anatinus]|uniref:Signal induced proliferation associated 1 like 2 n=1 Tax=Ornithorhynchus anatinus TaxID=9258 RepID=F7FH30_ORNAN|nr:signal-induced proliferation-associated 1-like protein 2 isoform X2 [Ornithorhynchus anatinus]